MTRILVVDDDELIAMALRVRLVSMGFEAVVAHNGEQAEGIVRDQHPDVVLTDITMPGCNGFDLADRLRAGETRSPIPVIFMTASMDPELLRRIASVGASGFLAKPYTPSELRAVIERALMAAAPDSGSRADRP